MERLSPPSEIDEGEENGGEDDGVPQNGLDAHLRRLLQGRRQRTLLVGGEGFAEPVEDNGARGVCIRACVAPGPKPMTRSRSDTAL